MQYFIFSLWFSGYYRSGIEARQWSSANQNAKFLKLTECRERIVLILGFLWLLRYVRNTA